MNKLVIKSLDQIDQVAEAFLTLTQGYNVIAFNGAMGAGKTTFIKSLCKKLYVTDEVNSPTFAIVNEYATKWSELVYHFDFYRVKNLREAVNIGAEDYFISGNKCFIEWPDVVEDILPDNCLRVDIMEIGGKRELAFQVN
jgi:tRNA threonylcarbamoyladenosine biosynthesis protein TsaE